ncbi:unnamed protein product [Ambrosiozyma monospora]|uniref:Unnamed protein product n=1 Tax=Ambrosiozyma monospora TaxID=43982 RepID=A0ACB5UD12_AMBMO|nr:unnamed protein product [Ambrosiozyma monospora]
MDRHAEVLRIFVNDLNDNTSAINYCCEVYQTNKSLGTKLGYDLIDLCLTTNGEAAIPTILNPKLNFLDPIVVLEKLPDETGLDVLDFFIEFNLRSINTELKNSIIQNELLKVDLIDSKLQKLEKEREYVRLTSSSICPVCGKHFNATSVVVVTTTGQALHYGCNGKDN